MKPTTATVNATYVAALEAMRRVPYGEKAKRDAALKAAAYAALEHEAARIRRHAARRARRGRHG